MRRWRGRGSRYLEFVGRRADAAGGRGGWKVCRFKGPLEGFALQRRETKDCSSQVGDSTGCIVEIPEMEAMLATRGGMEDQTGR